MKALVAIVSMLLVACGGNSPEAQPPVAPPTPSGDAGAPSATAPETPDAGASQAANASPADAGSSPPPDQPSKSIIAESKDECTPVGVDFEKRARPKLKECYATGKKKDPNLEGTVKIKVTVDVKGKIKSVKVVEKTLPDPVADCMLKVVKATPFPEVDKCWDSTLTIPITFPTPK
jgi:hypothetical protein